MARFDSLWPSGRTGLACGLAALVGAPSCRSGTDAGPAADSARSCALACGALVRSGCDRDGSRPGDEGACVAHCLTASREAEQTGCGRERAAYLACAAGRRLDCDAPCSAPLCLERGEGLGGCGAELAALERCRAPCAHRGVVTLVDRDAGAARLLGELTRAGCGACPSLDTRAPAGAPCQAASVCSQICCACPDGRARYLARVCLDGSCADAERACAAARSSGAEPCGGK